MSDLLLSRAQSEVARVKVLVDQGTLPKTSLLEAEARLQDAEDQAVLEGTLYGQSRVQDLTDADGDSMIQAAQRRVDRQQEIVAERQKMLDMGILAKSEFGAFQDELDRRKQVLQLAQNRVALLHDLRQMAATEAQLEREASAATAMIRYAGSGSFKLSDLPAISAQFEKQFHRALPVSAVGETLVHQSLGLDHRNRVDVALNPDSPEGVWLRHLLEQLHVPYLAFRSAIPGAATAPHVHIGPESTRLRLARNFAPRA